MRALRCTYAALGCTGFLLLTLLSGSSGLGVLWLSLPLAYLAAIALSIAGAVMAVRDREVGGWLQAFAVGVGVVLPAGLILVVAAAIYALSHMTFE
jgi:hypothetical protein